MKDGSMIMVWLALALMLFLLISCGTAIATEETPLVCKPGKYINIGSDPVNKNRALGPGEEVVVSAKDICTKVASGSGKPSVGLVPAGTEFVTIATGDPTLRKGVWIKKCGNGVLTDVFFRSEIHETVIPEETIFRSHRLTARPRVYFSNPVDFGSAYKDCPSGSSCGQAMDLFGNALIAGGMGFSGRARVTANAVAGVKNIIGSPPSTPPHGGPVNPNPPGGGGGPINPNPPSGGGGPANPNSGGAPASPNP